MAKLACLNIDQMKNIFLIFVIVLRAKAAAHKDSKIVGGYIAKIEDIPFIVSIQMENIGHFCGGYLLTLKHVMTACHCTAAITQGMKHHEVPLRDAETITVVAGTSQAPQPDEADRYYQHGQAAELMIHPNCNYTTTINYDFGMVVLQHAFIETERVKTFSYDRQLIRTTFGNTDNRPASENCSIAGWGTVAKRARVPSLNLKALRMKVISDSECRTALSKQDSDLFENFQFGRRAQMCLLSESGEEASDCSSDSGGPFFCGNVVYASVSYGYICGSSETPNVYAKLALAIDWIDGLNIIQREKAQQRKTHASRVATIHGGSIGEILLPFVLLMLT